MLCSEVLWISLLLYVHRGRRRPEHRWYALVKAPLYRRGTISETGNHCSLGYSARGPQWCNLLGSLVKLCLSGLSGGGGKLPWCHRWQSCVGVFLNLSCHGLLLCCLMVFIAVYAVLMWAWSDLASRSSVGSLVIVASMFWARIQCSLLLSPPIRQSSDYSLSSTVFKFIDLQERHS
jgi:hypothetical protein